MRKLIVQMISALVCIAPIAIAGAQTTAAKPFVGSLFTDNMVLQRGVHAPVWGWTTPGATVTVSVAGKKASAKAGQDGKWMAKLPPLPVGGPYTLEISGPTQLTLKNVMVGDVWICSGQSNMQMGIAIAKDAEAEIAAANYPNIRLFTVPDIPSFTPVENVKGQWDPCTPQTIQQGAWGGFSATGYYFGRELFKELNVPIGLLHTSWGGTIAEAWTSAEALNKNMPEFRGAVKQVAMAAKNTNRVDYAKQVASWYAENDPQTNDGAAWTKTDLSDEAWKDMPVPGIWEKTVLPNFDGIVWLRKEVTLPADASGQARLNLGLVDDNDDTWVNGQLIGSTYAYGPNRSYAIPDGVLKPGKNVIAVRVLDTGGDGGIYSTPEQMNLVVGDTSIPLAGTWKYKVALDLTKAKSPYPANLDNNPNIVTVLYNGMIAPLEPFAVKGAIWYQGEANADRAEQYGRLLPTMITDWRNRFGVGAFPFYIVQLASFMPVDTVPTNDPWPNLREAQYLTTKRVRNAGIATAIDIGDGADIHPKNKQEVGRRLALNALALTYGKKIEYSGPVYKSYKVEGNTIRVSFDHLGGGLTTADGKILTGFAIAGADGKFVWAKAWIDGDSVIVRGNGILNPTTVRYAWSNNPIANLANKAGLPALPFRTDGPTK